MENILKTFEEVFNFSAKDKEIIIPKKVVRYKRLSTSLKRNNPLMIWELNLPTNNKEGTKISLKEEGETNEGLITRLELNSDLDSIIDLKAGRTLWTKMNNK